MADKGSVTGKIAHYIRKNIRNGNWTVGEKIPSENQLCEELGVSRVSVRSALQQFIALGILESVHGKGTFVAQPKIATRSPSYHGVREQLEQQGYSTRTEMLNSGELEADVRLARELDVPVGTPDRKSVV